MLLAHLSMALDLEFGDHGRELREVDDESLLPLEGAKVRLGEGERGEEEGVGQVGQLQGQLLQ